MADFQQGVDDGQTSELRLLRKDFDGLKTMVALHDALLTGGANPPEGLVYKIGNLDLKMNYMLEQVGEIRKTLAQDKMQNASDVRALLFPLVQYVLVAVVAAAFGYFLSH